MRGKMMRGKITIIIGTVVVGLLLVGLLIEGCGPKEEAISRSYQCAVYTEQGCAKMIVASGGELEVQSGGTLDIQAGATTDFSGGIDLNGADLTVDTDGDTVITEGNDDVISTTLGAATGHLNILTGNFKVGNGTPTYTQNGEDAYVEGMFEVDGAAYMSSTLAVAGGTRIDGGLDLNGSDLTIDADADTIITEGNDDVISTTLGAATGHLNILTGNFKVGNGTPTYTQDGEDAYVEGMFEVDGAVYMSSTVAVAGATRIDGGLDLNASTLTIDADADTTMAASQDDVITFTVNSGTGYAVVSTGNFKVGNGTPTYAQDGEDAYVEGMFEVDGAVYMSSTVALAGAARFDGGLDLNGSDLTIDADADTIITEGNDDVISTTLGAGTGYLNVLTGNFKVGNGTPTYTQDGEDAYVEGMFEVDGAVYMSSTVALAGAARFDGGLDLNGSDLTIDADADTIITEGNDDVISTTLGAGTGYLNILTGNLKVGNGTPSYAQDGEDAYVEGTFEVDGAAYLGSTLGLSNTLTLGNGDLVVADDLRITAQTAITVTNGVGFTPSGTYQALQTSWLSNEVTPTITMAGTAGDVLILVNITTPTISIADSGTTMLSAEWEAGQYDTLMLFCDGTNWLEVSRSNN